MPKHHKDCDACQTAKQWGAAARCAMHTEQTALLPHPLYAVLRQPDLWTFRSAFRGAAVEDESQRCAFLPTLGEYSRQATHTVLPCRAAANLQCTLNRRTVLRRASAAADAPPRNRPPSHERCAQQAVLRVARTKSLARGVSRCRAAAVRIDPITRWSVMRSCGTLYVRIRSEREPVPI